MIAKCLDDLLGRQVTRKDYYIKEVVIAEGVENICSNCLSKLTRMTTVHIPKSVVTIEYGAFWGCRNLTEIYIPESVREIGINAFGNCPSLESIIIDADNKFFDSRDNCNAIIRSKDDTLLFGCNNSIIPNGIKKIDKHAFYYCKNMKSVKIPESLHKFSINTFSYRGSIDHLEVDKNNKYLDSRDDCNAIIRKNDNTLIFGCNKSTIPHSVQAIDCRAFEGCMGLTAIVFHNGINKIGERAFADSGLTSLVLPNSLTCIERETFYGCTSLTSVQIPFGVQCIGASSFENCSHLSDIIISDGLKIIGSNAFCGCQKLEGIKLPDSIEKIGVDIFFPQSLVKRIYIPKGSMRKFETLLPTHKEKLIEI